MSDLDVDLWKWFCQQGRYIRRRRLTTGHWVFDVGYLDINGTKAEVTASDAADALELARGLSFTGEET